jgi:hypothetical protein
MGRYIDLTKANRRVWLVAAVIVTVDMAVAMLIL